MLGLSSRFREGVVGSLIDWRNLFEDSHPSEIVGGFHLMFHEPYDMPSNNAKQFHTLTNLKVEYLIIPEMTSIDESLHDFSIEE